MSDAADAMGAAFSAWESQAGPGVSGIVAGFASDVAAHDVREEKSNDPLSPLISTAIVESEQARYQAARKRLRFRVYKDRKFAASGPLVEWVHTVCRAVGTTNIVYPLR